MRSHEAYFLTIVALLLGCAADDSSSRTGSTGSAGSGGSGAAGTGGQDSGGGGGADPPGCDPTQPFGTPVPLAELNTDDDDAFVRLTPDELTIVYSTDDNMFLALRASKTSAFGAPIELGQGRAPWISSDGLTLYFGSVSVVDETIMIATRASVSDDFGEATSAGIETGGVEWHPFVTADGAELWFAAGTGSIADHVWKAPITGNVVGMPAPVMELSGKFITWTPTVTADGLEIYVGAGASGNYDIHRARRSTPDAAFGAPEVVAELTNEGGLNRELPGWPAPDGCRLYFSASPGGSSTSQDLYYADKP
jgi:hypothetical protein